MKKLVFILFIVLTLFDTSCRSNKATGRTKTDIIDMIKAEKATR